MFCCSVLCSHVLLINLLFSIYLAVKFFFVMFWRSDFCSRHVLLSNYCFSHVLFNLLLSSCSAVKFAVHVKFFLVTLLSSLYYVFQWSVLRLLLSWRYCPPLSSNLSVFLVTYAVLALRRSFVLVTCPAVLYYLLSSHHHVLCSPLLRPLLSSRQWAKRTRTRRRRMGMQLAWGGAFFRCPRCCTPTGSSLTCWAWLSSTHTSTLGSTDSPPRRMKVMEGDVCGGVWFVLFFSLLCFFFMSFSLNP